MTRYLGQIRKFLVAAAAALSAIVTLDVLHGTAQTIAVTVSAALGAVLVHQVPNDPPAVGADGEAGRIQPDWVAAVALVAIAVLILVPAWRLR